MNTTGPILESNHTETLVNWVDQYTDGMMSWAIHKTGRKDIAEDIVQDTFLAAYQSYHRFDGQSSPKTWLFSILNRKIADHFREKYKGNKSTVDHSEALQSLMFKPDGHWTEYGTPREWHDDPQLLDNAEFNSTLANCMDKLPSHWHSVIQYSYLEEKKSKVICQELQITPTNLWQIVHRAKLQLRKCLETHWFAA